MMMLEMVMVMAMVMVMVMVNEIVEDRFNKTMKNNRNELLSIPSPLRHFLG